MKIPMEFQFLRRISVAVAVAVAVAAKIFPKVVTRL